MPQTAAFRPGGGWSSWSVAAIRLRHDVRRPASWGAVAVAAAAFAFAAEGLPVSATTAAVMTAAAVVAIGELPATFPVWDAGLMLQRGGWYRFSRQPLALPSAGGWLACRLCWPLLGLGGAAAGSAIRGNPTELTVTGVAAGAAATGLTALTTGGFRLAGLSAADTATATLLAGWLASAGMAATGSVVPASGEWPLLLVGVGCWLVMAGSLLGLAQWLHLAGGGAIGGLLPRQLPLAAASGPRRPDRLAAIGLLGVVPARSWWRRVLRSVAMLLALGGMIGWLLLDPASAGRYGLLAAAVFGAFGLPAAALLDGREVVRGWRSLIGSTGRPGTALPGFLAACGKSRPWPFSTRAIPENAEGFRGCRSPLPAAADFIQSLLAVPSPGLQATVVLVGHGVLMLWPPLVVAVVAVGHPAAVPALLTVAGLAAGAAVAGGGCVAARVASDRGETALTIGLGLLVGGVWLWQAAV